LSGLGAAVRRDTKGSNYLGLGSFQNLCSPFCSLTNSSSASQFCFSFPSSNIAFISPPNMDNYIHSPNDSKNAPLRQLTTLNPIETQ